VAAQLGELPPESPEALRRFEAYREAHFGVAAGVGGGGGPGEENNGSQNRDGPPPSPLKPISEMGLGKEQGDEPTPDDLRREMDAALLEITHLATALDRLLLAGACERVGRELGVLAERCHRRAAVDSAGLAVTVKERLTERGRSLYAMKLDSVLHALNQLRANSTYVVCPNETERAYVLKECDLNATVEALLHSLTNWGDDIVDTRDRQAADLTKFLDFRYQALMQELYRKRPEAEPSETALQRDAQVKGEVAQRGCKLVFEVDRLHRVIRDLRTVSRELDYRLSSEIWNKVRDAVASLTSKLGAEMGLFRESHSNRAASAAKQMRKIREHVAGQLADISSENYAAQQRAQQAREDGRNSRSPQQSRWDEDDKDDEPASPLMSGGLESIRTDRDDEQAKSAITLSDGMHNKFRDVERKDNQRLLQLEVQELQNRQILSRFFHHLKTQAMQQRFEEKMQALRMTLASNKELWDRLGNAAGRETNIERDFAGTAQQMSLAELKIEELRSQVEANTYKRQKLQGWRKNKARQVLHLEQKVRGHQRLGAINVEGMLQELDEKKELAGTLREERELEDDAANDIAERLESRNALMKAQLKEKQKAKQVAQQQLEKARKEVERGGLSEEERLKLWRGRIAAVKQRVVQAQLENQQLEAHMAVTLEQEEEEEESSSDDDW